MWSKYSGKISTDDAYEAITTYQKQFERKWWHTKLWKWVLPQKIMCFFELLLENMLLTWKNMMTRGWNGPKLCVICRKDYDSIDHLFFHCVFKKNVFFFVCG